MPPYSPDYNPIEEAFSKIKNLLRRVVARSREALVEVLGPALRRLAPKMLAASSSMPATIERVSYCETRCNFQLIDRYRVENGTYVDGTPAINALGCSAHWFETHPTYKNGGMVAIGYYEHGTHFLDVSRGGEITRKGYFLPHAGSTSAAYWVNRNIVYAVDYTRGIDILRYTGPGTDGPITGANQRGSGRG